MKRSKRELALDLRHLADVSNGGDEDAARHRATLRLAADELDAENDAGALSRDILSSGPGLDRARSRVVIRALLWLLWREGEPKPMSHDESRLARMVEELCAALESVPTSKPSEAADSRSELRAWPETCPICSALRARCAEHQKRP